VKTRSFEPTDKSGADSLPLEWIVVDGRDDADRAWIDTQSRFDDAVRAIVSKPPTHNERLHLGARIVLTLVRTDDTSGDELAGLSIVIEAHRVVTVCYGTDAIVEAALERQAGGSAPAGISRVLALLVTALVKPLEPEITRLSDKIDELEDAAMKQSDDALNDQVVLLGRQVLGLRRYLVPMHDELSFLALNPDELPGNADPRNLRRAAESLARLVSSLNSSHNRVQLILSQLRSHIESRQSRSMHKLSLVATVFLPLSFITGLLGINVAGIPDSHDPLGFWVVCGFLLGVAVASILFIRWRKWM